MTNHEQFFDLINVIFQSLQLRILATQFVEGCDDGTNNTFQAVKMARIEGIGGAHAAGIAGFRFRGRGQLAIAAAHRARYGPVKCRFLHESNKFINITAKYQTWVIIWIKFNENYTGNQYTERSQL